MIKALNRIFKQDKEKLTIPKSVQQVYSRKADLVGWHLASG